MFVKIGRFILHELQQMGPPTLFFLVSFNLITLTVAFLSEKHEVSMISHITATIGALLVGKAFLLADKLPFFTRYANKPLVYETLWKAFLYFMVTILLHIGERTLSAATDSKGFLFRSKADVAAFDWHLFIIVQLWLALLLVIYSVVAGVIKGVGAGRLRQMFLAQRQQADAPSMRGAIRGD